MKNNQPNDSPNLLPLVFIVVGTSLLAIPSALGTFALVSDSPSTGTPDGAAAHVLLAVSVAGFALHFGYILTLIFKRFFFLFWLSSTVYNAVLSAIYFYFFVANLFWEMLRAPDPSISLFIVIFLSWMIFMTASSIYYARHSLKQKSFELP